MWQQAGQWLRSWSSAVHGSGSQEASPSSEWEKNWQRREGASEVVIAGRLPGRRTPKLARLEAVLIVTEKPISIGKLTQHALLASSEETRQLIGQLNELYDADATPFRVEKHVAGYQLMTRSEYAFWLSRMHDRKQEQSISDSAMETLVIIAYRQPLTRAEIESIRGVQCVELIKVLMEKGLVKISGHADTLGRPYLYGTTRKFLETYGLRSLNELPMNDVLRPVSQTTEETEVLDEDGDAAAGSEDESAAA